jgi:predicted AlkP superfamily phosphohydrolase/phosphomutase
VQTPETEGWTFLRLAERALACAAAMATIAASLFASLNDLAPLERPSTFALAFLRWSLAFYGVVVTAGLAACWIAVRLARWRMARASPWLERVPLALVAVLLVLACLDRNGAAIAGLGSLSGPLRFRILVPASVALALGASLAAALLSPARTAWALALGAAAVAAAFVGFLPVPRPQAVVVAPRTGGMRESARRLLVVGVDGADWNLMQRLFAHGELPHLAALRARGSWGPLDTIVPTRSPALWNTMATGQPPERHGITSFSSLRVQGVRGVFRRARKPGGLGFHQLYALLERTGRVAEGPVTSSARRVPAFWNLATRERSPVVVVNWWATWPAEPVLGAIVSERVNYWRDAARGTPPEDAALTYPEDLGREIRPLIVSPDDVTYEQARPFLDVTRAEFAEMRSGAFRGKMIDSEFPYLFSMFETTRRIALQQVESTRRSYGAPADLMVLFRIVDIASHSALRYSELVDDHLGAPAEDLRRFGGTVSEAYRSVDRAVGELVGAMGDVNVVVVSDHGFQLEAEGAARTPVYHHMSGPPGVFLAAGPAFRRGQVDRLNIFEVFPLLSAVRGFPVADDLPARPPTRVLDPQYLASVPIRRVATYGRRRGSPPVAGGGSSSDDDALERLRALGYIQ